MSEPLIHNEQNEPRVKKIAWWQFGLLGVMFLMFVMFAAGLGRDGKLLPSPLIGKPAYAFDIPKLSSDERIKLTDYRGKVVVMNFWASWCVSCREEHHVLINTAKKLADVSNVQFLGINHKDTAQNAEAFFEKMGRFPYPSGVDGQGRLALGFGVYGMPETFFISPDGIIVAKHIGPLSEDALISKIERAAKYNVSKTPDVEAGQ